MPRFQRRANTIAAAASGADLPSDRAREVQKRLREERLRQGHKREEEAIGKLELAEREEEEKKGLLKKIWMGNEGSDWRKERDEREKQALEEGRGYGGLIMDQIREVWYGGKDSDEALKEKDEKAGQEKTDAGKN